MGDLSLIPGWGRSPGEGNGNPLVSCLENPTDRGAWWATAHGVTCPTWPLSILSRAQRAARPAAQHLHVWCDFELGPRSSACAPSAVPSLVLAGSPDLRRPPLTIPSGSRLFRGRTPLVLCVGPSSCTSAGLWLSSRQ